MLCDEAEDTEIGLDDIDDGPDDSGAVYLPTAEEIAEACAAIQGEWSAVEHERRMHGGKRPLPSSPKRQERYCDVSRDEWRDFIHAEDGGRVIDRAPREKRRHHLRRTPRNAVAAMETSS